MRLVVHAMPLAIRPKRMTPGKSTAVQAVVVDGAGPPRFRGALRLTWSAQRKRRGNSFMIASLIVSDIIRMWSWIAS